MALDDAMTAYRAAQADVRMCPTIVLRSRERRERRRVEAAAQPSHADIGRLAALRDELRARGDDPPEICGQLAPHWGLP